MPSLPVRQLCQSIILSMSSDTISTKQAEAAAICDVAFMVDCTPEDHSCRVCTVCMLSMVRYGMSALTKSMKCLYYSMHEKFGCGAHLSVCIR